MKRLLPLPALLLAASLAHAQQARDFVQFDGGIYALAPGGGQVLLYTSLADTAAKPSLRLARTKQVVIVGEFSPHWAVTRREGICYFVRQADLAGLGLGQTVRQVAATLTAPLPLDAGTHLIDFTKVVPAPGASKDELHARAKVWLAETFKLPRITLQVDDKDAGVLIGKGWQAAFAPNAFGTNDELILWYTVKFAFKDGRYRYNLTDFQFEYPASQYTASVGAFRAEAATAATRRDGTPTTEAKAYARALSQAAHVAGDNLERRLAQPATGNEF